VALKLQNEFVVRAPLEETWTMLLDLDRVSRCLPGASLEAEAGGGVHRGTMTVKLGPVTTEYRGTARLEQVDDEAHRAAIRVQGQATRGQGAASATINGRLVPEAGATRVILDSEVIVSGRPAQLGRGIMENVAAKLMSEFARRLEQEIAGKPGQPAGAEQTPASADAVREPS
jgi:carbon monoxide dehydrogenase subunit G